MEPDLNAMVEQLFSQPGSLEKLQTMLATLGSAAPTAPAVPATPAVPNLDALQRLLPLMNNAASGEHIALLQAVRPYLQGGREKRVDEAIELLKLARFLPLILQNRREEAPHD